MTESRGALRVVQRWLAFAVPVILCGCPSVGGQIGYTDYWSLPKNTPAALPKPKKAGEKTPQSFLPILGDFISGQPEAVLKSRSFGFWDDPANWYELKYSRTALANAKIGPGEYSSESVTLKNSVGISIGASKIPIEGGNLDLKIDGKREFELKDLKIVRLRLTHEYLLSLLTAWNEKEDAFFISAVVAADVSANTSGGLDLGYEPAPGSNLPDVALKANYENNYSGVGLIVGAEVQRIVGAGRSPDKALEKQEFSKTLQTLGVKVDFDDKLYIWNRVTVGGKARVSLVFSGHTASEHAKIFYVGGTHNLKGKARWITGNRVDLPPGEHVLHFIDLLGNKILASKVSVHIKPKPNGSGELTVEDLRTPRQQVMSWVGYTKPSEAP